MARSAIPRAATGGLLLRTVLRIVTACSTVVAVVGSTAMAATAGTTGASYVASGRRR